MEADLGIDIRALEIEYRTYAARATVFSEELTKQLTKLFEMENVALAFPIQRRVKTWDSLESKLQRMARPLQALQKFKILSGYESYCSLFATLRKLMLL